MAMRPENSESETAEAAAPLARHFLWADSNSGVRKLILGLIALSAVLFLADFVWHRHVKVPGEEAYGFHAIAGFLSFTLIVLGARLLRVFIQRDESFYAPHGVDAENYPEAGTEKLVHANRGKDDMATFTDELLGRDTQGNLVDRESAS